MLKIGSHVGMSAPLYFEGSVRQALSYNANTFMFYTGAPQNAIRTPIEKLHVKEALELLKEHNIDIKDIVVHAPYIINLANTDESKFEFSVSKLIEEVERVAMIGCKYLVLHPGSHVGLGVDNGINSIIKGLNIVLDRTKGMDVVILLETMAGKGSELGKTFEEIKTIMDGVNDRSRIGVCLDTCHIHDGGYDIISSLDWVIDTFDKVIGLSSLYVVHVNDSKNIRGAHKDRHENFGFGEIGFNTLINVIYHPRLEHTIKILETPYIEDNPPYKEEIEMIRKKVFNPNMKDEILSK